MKNKLISYITIFVFTLLSNGVFAEALTHKMVKEMVKEMDKTIAAKDIESMASFISPNVSVKLHVTTNGKRHFSNIMNKNGYLDLYRKSMKEIRDYKYQREDLQIKIRSDGKSAFVKGKVRESMVIEGRQVDSITIEEAIIELIEGTPIYVQVTTWTTI